MPHDQHFRPKDSEDRNQEMASSPALPDIVRKTGVRKWHNRPSTSGHHAEDRNQEVAQQAQHFRSSRGRQEPGSGTTGPALPVITRKTGTRKWQNRPSTSGHHADDRNQEVAQQAQHFQSSRGRQETGSGKTGPALPVITPDDRNQEVAQQVQHFRSSC